MQLSKNIHQFQRGRGQCAFTLVEVMTASGILLLLMGGILASQLFGMRILQTAQLNMGASELSRDVMSSLQSDVRTATSIKIGSGGLTTFTEASANSARRGNAIQIYYVSTNANAFVRYWVSSTNSLTRMTNGKPATVLAPSVATNSVFTLENFAGNVITNAQQKMVLGVNLQFRKLQSPAVAIGSNNHFKTFPLLAKISVRTQ